MSRKLRFGITYLPTDPPDIFTALVKYVDRSPFDFFWVADTSLYGRYVYSYLTIAALNSERVRIGPNCTHPLTRNPAVSFNALATLDELSKGRAIMNIGAGGGTVKELGYGGAKLKSIREMIEQGRALLSGNPVHHEGEGVTLKGAKLRFLHRHDLPIYMTASGPKMLAMSGELCDGVIFMAGTDRACVDAALADVAAGATSAKRPVEAIDRACCVFGNLGADREDARNHCRAIAAWMVTTQPRYAKHAGIGADQVEAVKIAFSGSAHGPEAKRAASLVTDKMIDTFTLAGDAQDFIKGIERLVAAGVGHIEFFPEGGDNTAMTKMFVEQVIPHFR